jgi:hypothetical protein
MQTEWKYACVNRPPGFGSTPRGFIRCDPSDPKVPMARHGFVVYDRELSELDCYNYEIYPHRSLEEIVAYYIPLLDEYNADDVRKYGTDRLSDGIRGRHGSFAGGYTDCSNHEVVAAVVKALLEKYPVKA